MAKRVVIIVVVLVLAVFAYISYNHYDGRRAGVSGEVFSNDPQPGKTKTDSVSRTATDSSDKKAADSDADAIVYPSSVTAQPNPAEGARPASSTTDVQVTQTGQSAQDVNLQGDTISPNPPNGMIFAGKGRYQLYRQGNITWRVNTETGKNCILFATDEEWKKPRVYRAGCGSSQ